MTRILTVFAVAALACGASATEANGTTTTSARIAAEPTPSPPPVIGERPNAPGPLPQLGGPSATYPTPAATVQTIQQGENPVDMRLATSLTSRLQDDDKLSDAAKQHVRVIAHGGRVVVEGRVPTMSDLVEVDSQARALPGAVEVDDRVVVGR